MIYRFERIPEAVMTVFLNTLEEFRGDHIRKMDERLACHLDDILHGRSRIRKFRFEQLDLRTLQSYCMDSDELLSTCNFC